MWYSAYLPYDLIYKLAFNSLYSQVSVIFSPCISSICLQIWVRGQSGKRVVNYNQNNLSFHKPKHYLKPIFVYLKSSFGISLFQNCSKSFFSRNVLWAFQTFSRMFCFSEKYSTDCQVKSWSHLLLYERGCNPHWKLGQIIGGSLTFKGLQDWLKPPIHVQVLQFQDVF